MISGATLEELKLARPTIFCAPPANVKVEDGKTWDDSPYLQFSAKVKGDYWLVMSLPPKQPGGSLRLVRVDLKVGEVTPPPPTPDDNEAKAKVTVTASPTEIESGGKATVKWAGTVAVAKVILKSDPARPLAVSGQMEVTLSATTKFDFEGTTKKGKKVAGSVTVKVKEPPPPPPTPIKVSGLYVLMIHDPTKKLPQDQDNVFANPRIQEWLNANCTKDKANTPAWRVLKPGHVPEHEVDSAWADGIKFDPKGTADPYWLLLDEKHGVLEPIPANVDTALARLQQFKNGG